MDIMCYLISCIPAIIAAWVFVVLAALAYTLWILICAALQKNSDMFLSCIGIAAFLSLALIISLLFYGLAREYFGEGPNSVLNRFCCNSSVTNRCEQSQHQTVIFRQSGLALEV